MSVRVYLDAGLASYPVEVIGHRSHAGPARVVLLPGSQRSRSGDGAPVIKHLGHMTDRGGLQLFAAAQGQVPILAALEADAESANLPHQGSVVQPQVANAVLPKEQFMVPVGLEVRGRTPAPLVDLVFVGVDHPPLGMGVDGFHHLKQGMRSQLVIMVEQRDELASSQLQRRIGRL